MSWCDDARELDKRENVVEAIAAYEMAAAEGSCSLADLVNLAVLYLEAADPGFSTAHRLPPDLVEDSFRRAMSALDRAEDMVGHHPTVQFWQAYIPFVVLGEDPHRERLEELAAVSSLPSLYLALQPDGEAYRKSATRLVDDTRNDPTAAARYIRSVLSYLQEPSRNRRGEME